ncbi:hypothetical protein U6A24_15250 [Aquimarina gracilis]|uniref:Membrane metalloprotease n=1 Tax=Aquimarina gracilis TaxID=874422 RepID=A0ABU5ZY84_9FLAO|nr:hypothetical protein [Aquimarina gracilis]MEB3346834.1 hypothetical protein [Aquimarina gracilis]
MQITKFLSYLFISSFILVGCSDDDNDSPFDNNPSQAANRQPLGTSANDLLSDTNFKSLTVEMVAVQGFEPTATAVNNFRQFLENRVFKPDGITINLRTVSSANKAPFTTEEIAEIENDTRTLFNAGDDITVYVYFADGSKEDDTTEQITLGTAYLNTSVVIYEGTLRRLGGSRPGGPSLSDIETAALNHEFAHLLGLVNIGTPLQSDHEDPDSNGHCNVPNCLMEAAIEFSSGIMGMGDSVPELDDLCIADLQANGGR